MPFAKSILCPIDFTPQIDHRLGSIACSKLPSISSVMMALFSCGFLPGIVRFWNFPNMQWSTWCLASGFFAALLTFFLWRPQQPVFLDKICINEQENEQKCENIFSLAGILKRSDEASF